MLTIFQGLTKQLMLWQTDWASKLNPLLELPITSGIILPNIALTIGSNTVPHLLSRRLQGWFLVRQRALASIYDTQTSNANPTKTLILVSSATVTVDIYVF